MECAGGKRSLTSMHLDELHHTSPLHLALGAALAGAGSPAGLPPRGAAKRKPGSLGGVFPVAGMVGPTSLMHTAGQMLNHGQATVTGHPSNESELQLYGVLQRAKLLSYYDTFIAQGGDDVHQLCEAGEEEFLEIMALVGMASKPLHVRRLQKALQEWVQNPSLFQASLMPLNNFPNPNVTSSAVHSPIGHHPIPIMPSGAPPPTPVILPAPSTSNQTLANLVTPRSPSPSLPMSLTPTLSIGGMPHQNRSQAPQGPAVPVPLPGQSPTQMSRPSSVPHSPSPVGSMSAKEVSGQGGEHSPAYSQGCLEYPMMSTSPLQLTPVLTESQIARIAETSARLVKALPSNFEPNAKQLNKKKLSKELEVVITMSNNDNHKMDEIRKFSAIYGRFDCKRKPEKPLTLHEVSVNEAAAQLCFLLPGLLMRRDKLFHLARKVVRDSGYQYSKGHSRSQFQADPSDLLGVNVNGGDDNSSRDSSTAGGDNGNSDSKSKRSTRFSDNDDYEVRASSKRRKYSENEELDFKRRERFEQLTDEIRFINEKVEELQNAFRQNRDAGLATAISQQLELLHERKERKVQEQKEHSRAFHSFGRFSGRISTLSDPEHNDSDDDSQLSYSNHSSPTASPKSGSSQQQTQHAGSFVLSASGSQIIAVQNPALSMSGSMLRSSPSTGSPHHRDSGGHYHHMSTTSALSSSSPLSAMLSVARKDEGSNESDFHKSNRAILHLKELRSSNRPNFANDASDLKEDSSTNRRRSPTPNSQNE